MYHPRPPSSNQPFFIQMPFPPDEFNITTSNQQISTSPMTVEHASNEKPQNSCTNESYPSTYPDNLSIGVWNVCGWSLDPFQTLCPKAIKAIDLDIVCLRETFLRDEKNISVEGYSWFGNNHKRKALWGRNPD